MLAASGRSPAVERARELLEVEGIAAALLVQRGRVDAVSQELARLLERERRELEPREPSRAVGAFERSGQPLRALSWADRHREQHGRRRRAAQERADQLDRPGVGPVQVVEDQDERLRRREQLQQLADGAVRAVALVLERRPAAGVERDQAREARVRAPREPGRRGRSRRRGSRPSAYSSRASTKTQNGRSRSSSDAEPARTSCPRRVGALRELGEQAGLADAGLADELDRAREALLEICEQLVERVELRGTPDELLGRVDDRLPPSLRV